MGADGFAGDAARERISPNGALHHQDPGGANHLECEAKEGPSLAGSGAATRRTIHPLQLLCRALRLAPTSYRRFEITAAQPDAPISVSCATEGNSALDQLYMNHADTFECCVAELAAEMQAFAIRESVSVALSEDERVVTLGRDRAEPACRQA